MNSALSGVVGFLLIIGTIISYGIQFHKIIVNKSIDGINISSLVMGVISSILTMYASILLNLDELSSFTIGLDVSQLIVVCICWLSYLLIYMYHTKKPNSNSNRLLEFAYFSDMDVQDYKYTFILFCLSWIVFICFGTVSIIIPQSTIFIDIMFSTSAVMSVLQWIPQVIESYTTTIVTSSLSLITLSINTSGCILTVIYQSVINGEKVVLMIPYIVGAILQISIMVILKFKKPRAIFDDYNDLGRFDNYEDSREDVPAAVL
ncbi:uncharacterized protein METZ01_LOCUS112662 [marine metagenome]|uniref:PQ-loop repeat-containing protein n=1 Tax=marine metagenome TaxID=408172 RepID=A0A381X564_9ZZZZ